MAEVRKVGDLEFPEDLALQRATWRFQRIAWCSMAAILIAALLGLFGGDTFGPAMVGQSGGPRVEFSRFCRLRSPTTLDVFLPAGKGGEARVWVAFDYADPAGIVRVEPDPARVETSPGGLVYVASTTPSDRLTRVRFHLSPGRPGLLRGSCGREMARRSASPNTSTPDRGGEASLEPVLRALAVYAFLLVLMRASGRRTLAESTTFDFVLLLIISEATQNAMIGEDYSVTNAFLVILTLVSLDIGFSLAKRRWARLDKWVEGIPTILVENGQPIGDRMTRARVDVDDVLEAARKLQGLERMDQIKYAILERSGGISIIPAHRG